MPARHTVLALLWPSSGSVGTPVTSSLGRAAGRLSVSRPLSFLFCAASKTRAPPRLVPWPLLVVVAVAVGLLLQLPGPSWWLSLAVVTVPLSLLGAHSTG